MAVSPTSRSLKLLRDRGYAVDIAESYNAFTKRRKDQYGFIDIVGLHLDEPGVLGIQTTTGANLSARLIKAQNLKAYWNWLACGNDVEFHGWRKLKAGKKVATWHCKLWRISFNDWA
jgi:hypothetical protein